MLSFLHCKKAMNNNTIYIVMPSFAKEYHSSIGTRSFLYTRVTFARLAQ